MLRKGDYKYIHYVGERPQLFNLKDDPDELVDLGEKEEGKKICSVMEAELRTIVDIEKTDREAIEAQKEVLENVGGKEEFLKTFVPALFSPIPDLNK